MSFLKLMRMGQRFSAHRFYPANGGQAKRRLPTLR